MKKKNKFWFYAFVIMGMFLMFTSSCKKDDEPAPELIDQLSDSQIQLIEAAGIDTVSAFEDAQFSDGSNISDWALLNDSGYVFTFDKNFSLISGIDKKNLFIERMTFAGFILIDDKLHSYPSQLSGLAYVYGSKSFTNPSTYPGAACQQLLYGLDCSGMIYQMARASGLNLPSGGTANYVYTSTWNAAFNNTSTFQDLEMTDFQALHPSQLQAGDIIVASEKHIGMVFNNGNNLGIFNSLGKLTYPCSTNSNKTHGPVITNNIPAWLKETFGSNYHVLRVKTIEDILSGIWILDLTLGNGVCDETLLQEEENIPPTFHFNSNSTITFDTDPQEIGLNGARFTNTYTFSNDTLKIKSYYVDQNGSIKFDATLIYDNSTMKFTGNYSNIWEDNIICSNTLIVEKLI
jgi:hypothetical protein